MSTEEYGRRLREILERLPSLYNQDSRKALLDGIPGNLQAQVQELPSKKNHLVEIIRYADGWGYIEKKGKHAFLVIAENALENEKGTDRGREIEEWIEYFKSNFEEGKNWEQTENYGEQNNSVDLDTVTSCLVVAVVLVIISCFVVNEIHKDITPNDITVLEFDSSEFGVSGNPTEDLYNSIKRKIEDDELMVNAEEEEYGDFKISEERVIVSGQYNESQAIAEIQSAPDIEDVFLKSRKLQPFVLSVPEYISVTINQNNSSEVDYISSVVLGLERLTQGKLDSAEEYFQNAVDVVTQGGRNTTSQFKPTEAYLYRGLIRFRRGHQDEEVLSDYTYVLSHAIEDQQKTAAYNNRGVFYAQKERYEESIADYTAATNIIPNDPAFYINRGYSYDRLGRYEEAITDYTKSIDLAPHYATTYLQRGDVYAEIGAYPEAIADYTSFIHRSDIHLSTDHAETIYTRRGDIYLKEGMYSEAVSDYTELIGIDPKNPTFYTTRGVAYTSLGDYQNALKDYGKAIELASNHTLPYYNRAITHRKMGNYRESIEDYTNVLDLMPGNSLAYNNRALIYIHLGEYEKAIADFEKAIEFAPNEQARATASTNLMHCYEKLNSGQTEIISPTTLLSGTMGARP